MDSLTAFYLFTEERILDSINRKTAGALDALKPIAATMKGSTHLWQAPVKDLTKMQRFKIGLKDLLGRSRPGYIKMSLLSRFGKL